MRFRLLFVCFPLYLDVLREGAQRFIRFEAFFVADAVGAVIEFVQVVMTSGKTNNEGFLSRDNGDVARLCQSGGGPRFVCTFFGVGTSLCALGHDASMARLIAQPAPLGNTFGCWPGPWPLATGVSVEFPRLNSTKDCAYCIAACPSASPSFVRSW